MYGKYVILGQSPIIFDINIKHSDVVKLDEDVRSAGYFVLNKLNNGLLKVSCFGESRSLNKKSIPDLDSYIIGTVLNEFILKGNFVFSTQ